MTAPNQDTPIAVVEYAGRIAFALLAFLYIEGLAATPWAAGTALPAAALAGYLVVQTLLFASRARLLRRAPALDLLAPGLDLLAVMAVVVLDPYPAPPTLLLMLMVALNAGLRRNWLHFLGAALAAGACTGVALQLRAMPAAAADQHALTWLLLFSLACLVYFVLLALRRQNLLAHAARYADIDADTQLLNRRGFDSAARYLVPLHQRTRLPLVLMLASVHTREADLLPYDTERDALRQLADGIRERARRSDVAARLEGNEVVLMLFDTPLSGGETLARALGERFHAWAAQAAPDAHVTLAMIAMPEEPVAIDQLLARARSALDRASRHPSTPLVVTAPAP
jgi:diguanylate cyclase (GGDEF)-like protein